MKEKWLQLDSREQQGIIACGVVLIAAIFYFFILSPLSSRVNLLKSTTTDNEALIAWMHYADSQLSHSPEKTQVIYTTSQQLLSVIQQTLNTSAVATASAEIKQTSSKTVAVQFKSVNFDSLIEWLVTLWLQHHISIDQVDIVTLEEPGVVQASVILKT